MRRGRFVVYASRLHRAAGSEPSEVAPSHRRRRVAIALGANQFLSSGTHLIAKAAVMALGALPVALLRFTLASVSFLILGRVRGGWPRIDRRDVPKLLLIGFLVVPVNQGFFLFGLVRSTPTHASLLYALTPLVVLALAGRMLREGNLGSKLAGAGVAFSGVVVILLERGLRQEGEVLVGDLLILVAVFAWALYTVLSKPLAEKYGSFPVTAWAITSGTVFSLPGYLVPGVLPPLRSISPAVWGGILYLSIGTSLVAYPLWMYALKHVEASKVAITTNLQPILTAIFSWILFRERFTPGFLVGAVLVLGGLTWVETRKETPVAARAPSGAPEEA